MNGMNGYVAAPVLWQEARNPEGRVYYYNTITKATQWTKPEDLMSPAERALANQPWKEYTAEGGRKYWYNTETKQSSWEMPAVYKEALAKENVPEAQVAATPTFVAGGGFSSSQFDHPRDREAVGEARQIAYGNDINGGRNQVFVPANSDPNYNSFEEAEAAFMKLLRRNNVSPDWIWEKTLRVIIKDSQYRALKDPAHRKAAFEKYAVEVRIQEKDKAKERIEKLRTDFATMLKSHSEIKHYTRWKTARPIIEGETIFRSTDNEDERRHLFEDYIIELKKAQAEREANTRRAAEGELVDILKSLQLEPYTRWSEAQGIIQSNPRFQSDEKFQALSKSDLLTAFENHIKNLEQSLNNVKQLEKNLKSRRERQNRDNFLELLTELRKAGHIKAGSSWTKIHPLVVSDDRYVAILGQSGSSPLDLFWDLVEDEERALRSTRNDVLDVLEDKKFEVQQKTPFEEFLALMQNDRRTANIDRDSLTLIFERLREKVSRRNEDNKYQAERHQRRAVDALRSLIKHLEPPIRVDDTFERVHVRFDRTQEWQALESDELRRSAFDKVIRRLKEKEEDAERDRQKRRERISVDRSTRGRDNDREREREGSHRRHGRPSRSPEPDAYEADRRKAIADREKNYRKGSVADTLLSPRRGDRSDYRERDYDDRRDFDRPHRPRRDDSASHYDRERRDRETEREKLYRRRGDPRGAPDELPWGDDKPSVPAASARRRRADSDNESIGSARLAKRSRTELTPAVPARSSRTKTPPAAIKEEAAVHSGSEEGEIEEE
ncbi:formin binding protein-like protein [Calycina marina]|uniref:Formin binding protein-like protein n=1 Tax=Calycina marina TaxID=1763456 RepID=A0A9P7Z9E5_9HELO|nr:formin binding protein-like protein [Calycina marina]